MFDFRSLTNSVRFRSLYWIVGHFTEAFISFMSISEFDHFDQNQEIYSDMNFGLIILNVRFSGECFQIFNVPR